MLHDHTSQHHKREYLKGLYTYISNDLYLQNFRFATVDFKTLSDQGSLYSAETIKENNRIQHIVRKENDNILLIYR